VPNATSQGASAEGQTNNQTRKSKRKGGASGASEASGDSAETAKVPKPRVSKPRGRTPKGKQWDGDKGTWVDEKQLNASGMEIRVPGWIKND